MFGAIIGFVAPFLPDLIGMGKSWMDARQERQMMELRFKYAEREAEWRMEEIQLAGAYKDRAAARKQRESYGVQILNAAHDAENVVAKWCFNIVFLLFSALDWFISSVRPTVTYYIVGLWGAIKLAVIVTTYRETGDFVVALLAEDVWTSFDQDLLLMVLAYWFGESTRRRMRTGTR